MALLLDADEVTRIVRSRETRTNLTKEETEAFLPGTHDTVVNALIASDYLTLVEEFSPDARRMIPVVSRESAEAFRRRFVSLGELCQKTRMHHKQVRALLRLAGIMPTLLPETVGAFFFNRQSVEHFEADNRGAWAYDKASVLKMIRNEKGEARRAAPSAVTPRKATSGPGGS
ncbi:hypothetical protein EN801_032430 [Mesorhizobium sp. M00.F.Ca.ET.158.01.1.1]|nr:hypothetical protein EN801_032430 [Mesorhizobium sp. M00.F.Ca.ET.158.01.1.1]